jgi:hypothetical protein
LAGLLRYRVDFAALEFDEDQFEEVDFDGYF